MKWITNLPNRAVYISTTAAANKWWCVMQFKQARECECRRMSVSISVLNFLYLAAATTATAMVSTLCNLCDEDMNRSYTYIYFHAMPRQCKGIQTNIYIQFIYPSNMHHTHTYMCSMHAMPQWWLKYTNAPNSHIRTVKIQSKSFNRPLITPRVHTFQRVCRFVIYICAFAFVYYSNFFYKMRKDLISNEKRR